ncbi:MAG: 23S rRNA (uracil(1939)-C(5))-methyltransferase RlmD [Thiotrichales bacterium]|nr:23S rRNA (uracil(1939)-C(5))-methyltransferase RlmD [Thiotrichales bacterium]
MTKTEPNTQPNIISHLDIEGLTHDGRGVTRQNGKAIFVPNAVPGDMVKVKITQSQAKFDEAELLEIEQASSDRTPPFCPLYNECGGCQLQHLSIDAQRHWKTENFITRLTQSVSAKHCKVAPALIGNDTGYRRRARLGLSISKIDKVARLGFRQHASNELVDIDQCPVLTPALNLALKDQRATLLEQASRAYKEITFVEADNGVFSVSSADTHDTSIEPLYDIEGLQLNFPADGFVQVNREQNLQMVKQAIEWLELDTKQTVLDLFCGVGNFTLPISKHCKMATGIEGLAELVDTANHNAKQNQLDNVDFIKTDLFEDFSKLPWFRKQKYSRILLDPGRQGAFEISKVLHELKPEIIVYVSCNASTLIRDIRELEKQGYHLHKAGLIDMFPHTTHTEVMVQLKKGNKKVKKPKKIFRF